MFYRLQIALLIKMEISKIIQYLNLDLLLDHMIEHVKFGIHSKGRKF